MKPNPKDNGPQPLGEVLPVQCNCGYRLGIQDQHLEEITAGVWGTIPCPNCGKPLNEKIENIRVAQIVKHYCK